MKQIEINLSSDLELAIERYTAAALECARNGAMSEREREEVRSYAAEVTTALLNANPETFRYAADWQKIRNERQK